MSWITFQIGSMLLMSVNSILDKRLIRDHASNPVIQLASFAIVGTPVVVAGLLMLPWIGFKPAVLGILSGIIFSLAVLLYYKALGLDDLSRLVPILRLSGVLQLTMLGIILDDRLTLFQYLAFIAMLTGAFALSWKAQQHATSSGKHFQISGGVLLMGLVAVLLAFQGVIDSYLVIEYSPWILIVWSNAGTILGFCLVLISRQKRRQLVEGVITISLRSQGIIIGQQISRLIVGLLGDFAVNQAGSAAIAFVFGGLRPALVLVMAIFFLGEQIDRRERLPKILGICLLGIGTGLLFLSA